MSIITTSIIMGFQKILPVYLPSCYRKRKAYPASPALPLGPRAGWELMQRCKVNYRSPKRSGPAGPLFHILWFVPTVLAIYIHLYILAIYIYMVVNVIIHSINGVISYKYL